MNIKPHFKQIILVTLFILNPIHGHSAVNDNAIMIVRGTVTKGTCTFNISDQTVKFSQSILMQNVAEIGEREENKLPFSINYVCQDYVDETPDMEMKIKAGTGTEITNNKISSINSPTNASFVLYDCKKNQCSLVNFNAGVSSIYIPTGNGNKNKEFQVELVKKGNTAVSPGTLKTILEFTLIQP
ncbi:TPA: type 1 fimbrial protein [Proteus mirabilis]|nr:type 1 fimbrial protein [Proteus mirabilis]